MVRGAPEKCLSPKKNIYGDGGPKMATYENYRLTEAVAIGNHLRKSIYAGKRPKMPAATKK